MTVLKKIEVPISEKFCLTIEESAAYFGIGENKLRALVSNDPYADYILKIGKKTLIKRVLFENYINSVDSI